jgi:hypothetical protein
MPAKKSDRAKAREKKPRDTQSKSAAKTSEKRLTAQSDRGLPGEGQGRVDITGRVAQDVKVDPYVTEGHPGYEESGGSELRPAKRLPAADE